MSIVFFFCFVGVCECVGESPLIKQSDLVAFDAVSVH